MIFSLSEDGRLPQRTARISVVLWKRELCLDIIVYCTRVFLKSAGKSDGCHQHDVLVVWDEHTKTVPFV